MADEDYLDMHHASFKAMLKTATNALLRERSDSLHPFLVSFVGPGGSASHACATEQVDTRMPSQFVQSMHLGEHHDALKAMVITSVIVPRCVRSVNPRAFLHVISLQRAGDSRDDAFVGAAAVLMRNDAVSMCVAKAAIGACSEIHTT